MPFKDREQAAHLLAEQLFEYRGQNPLVMGIPRGAVPMAKIIADALDGELDVVLVHKLSAPNNSELAIGSIDEDGHVYLERQIREKQVSDPAIRNYIHRETQAQLAMLRQRRNLYTPVHPPINPAGRIAIVVDNGVATGFTILAALRGVRIQNPLKLIAAMVVAPKVVVEQIAPLADEVVCLDVAQSFYSVGEFYENFRQVSDEEVIQVLRQAKEKCLES